MQLFKCDLKSRSLVVLLMGLFILLSEPANARSSNSSGKCEPTYQLRLYELPAENVRIFHDRFRRHALPIMERYGFGIVAMWESHYDGGAEFIYLLVWPDHKTMEAQWRKFLADKDWRKIKAKSSAEHGNFVNTIEDRTLCLTPYSPNEVTLHNTRQETGGLLEP